MPFKTEIDHAGGLSAAVYTRGVSFLNAADIILENFPLDARAKKEIDEYFTVLRTQWKEQQHKDNIRQSRHGNIWISFSFLFKLMSAHISLV